MVQIPEDLDNWDEYRGMVHWFSPKVLLKVVQKVIASTLFGQYADRRLVHASLDVLDDAAIKKRCGINLGHCASADGPVWIDYVADLGEGFDSTYAIAYLIGQKEIVADGMTFPRAHCLIMGGDQVYPDASREDYEKRMQRPYGLAFPRTQAPGAHRPPVFLIPGNHDWYDGLTLFLAKFCRGTDTHLGSWNAAQSRSYFAVHLKDNWWVWGYDSQLGEDIDQPQANYFTTVAKMMNTAKGVSKVILCASIPSWLKAEQSAKNFKEREMFYQGLDYVAGILKDNCNGAKIPLVLAGDQHHYSRYTADEAGTHFITAGGGGAFLHPTHNLPPRISASWVKSRQILNIATKTEPSKTDNEEPTQTDVCYPSRKTSRSLAWRNLGFVFKNSEFCLTLGFLYWLSALALLGWRGYGHNGGTGPFVDRAIQQISDFTPTPAFVLVGLLFCAVLTNYADIRNRSLKYILGGLHGLLHTAIVAFATGLSSVAVYFLQNYPGGEILYFFGLGLGMAVGGFIGGFAWGMYLLAVSFWLGEHANDAFSAMRLDKYRHFLRMKIDGDELTVFPIGIDKSPKRRDWVKNAAYTEGNQNTPFFVPMRGLGQKLIEKPITIYASKVKPLKRVVSNRKALKSS